MVECTDSICAVCFREVPQESTGFSHFKLMYGWDVWGPIDVLKDEWTQDLTYVTTVREHSDSTYGLVEESVKKAEAK